MPSSRSSDSRRDGPHHGRHTVWGVLVSQQPCTAENGLAAYVEHRQYPVPDAQLHAQASTEAIGSGAEMDAQRHSIDYLHLWRALSPHVHSPDALAPYLPHLSRTTHKATQQQPRRHTPDADASVQGVLVPPDILVVPLWRDVTSIGRLASNDVPVPTNPCVSGVHCAVSLIVSAAAPRAGTPRVASAATRRRDDVSLEGADASNVGRLAGAEAEVARIGDASVATGESQPRHTAGDAASREKDDEDARGESAGGGESDDWRHYTVRVSDYSTNGCAINSVAVGKGKSYAPLLSGDVVELMNAGPRHTPEYNLKFVFYTVEDYVARLTTATTADEEEAATMKTKAAEARALAAAAAAGADSERQARRRALLVRAQWNVLAQVHRMYHHDVEDFYVLDTRSPLGEGGFGKVYRGALRSMLVTATTTNASRSDLAERLKALAPVPAHYAHTRASTSASRTVKGGDNEDESKGATDGRMREEEEEEVRKTNYVELKAWEAPSSVYGAIAASAKLDRHNKDGASPHHHSIATTGTKRSRTCVEAADDSKSGAPALVGAPSPCGADFIFAVKVVNKKRLLLDALADASNNNSSSNNKSDTEARAAGQSSSLTVPLNDTDKATLRHLLQLETQQEDYAAQREQDLLEKAVIHHRTACSSQSWREDAHVCDDAAQQQKLCLLNDVSSQSVPASLNTASAASLQAALLPPLSSEAQEAKARAEADRARRRDELLAKLPDQLRRFYQKELQQKRRQQCEINILLAVHHPCIARLYEVFDGPARLALVMEQATGGEVWDLLQPPKQNQSTTATTTAAAAAVTKIDNSTNSTRQGGEAVEDEGLSSGGPLPEFIVKMILVQVLEAVHYLHSMGIVHRDLKLENLLLQRPCPVAGLSALQLNVLTQKLQDVRHRRQPASGSVTATRARDEDRGKPTPQSSSETSRGGLADAHHMAIASPLSLVHTVHVPKAMWPVVKVTDFGLSHVMNVAGGGESHLSRSGRSRKGGEPTSHSSNRATDAEDVDNTALVYARNDMVTSCGTPIYAAPEVVNPQLRPDRVGYSAAVDMYSVGVIAFALLTGRAPFPSRPRGRHGGAVVDYTAPLTFERYRKKKVRRHPQEQPPPPHDDDGHASRAGPTTTVADLAPKPLHVSARAFVPLPPLACVEELRVLESDTMVEPGCRPWERAMHAFETRITAAERCHGAPLDSEGQASGQVFDGLLTEVIAALGEYADARTEAGLSVDIDRFVWRSTQYHTQQQQQTGVDLNHRDDVATQFPLPPVSRIGQDFLRSLLLARPTERLTARQALEHPWLRDCAQ